MKKSLLSVSAGVFCLLASLPAAKAAVLCTDPSIIGAALTPATVCDLGGLEFSNFKVVQVIGSTPTVSIAGSTGVVGNVVNLDFGINMAGVQDIHFIFEVTGSILGGDLFNGGSPDSNIEEKNCSTHVADNGSNCTLISVLPSGVFDITIPGNGSSGEIFYTTPQTDVWVWKDISVNGGSMSSFSESFVVPEPMTLSLMGVGLLGIGLLGRRLRK